MRNLKRALSLTLASVMLLGMMIVGSSALSFNDADDISNVTAATILEELGVMQGDGKGNFMPDQTVTRGQMAILICKMLYGDKLNVSQFSGSTSFNDVPANAYYTGYVNLASSLGIISGYGDGNFGPGDPITTAQAALMLSRALGWFQAGELSGQGWASNALTAMSKATQINLFGDLRLETNTELSRDNVCGMVFNAMTKTTPVMYNDRWGVYYTDSDNVLAGTKFDYRDTLGYENYDLVYKDDGKDDFERPSTQWGTGTISGSNQVDAKGDLLAGAVTIRNSFIKSADEPEVTYTKKKEAQDIYSDMGKPDIGTVKYYLNGVETPVPANFQLRNGCDVEIGAKGSALEVYRNKDNNNVTIIVVDTYLVKANSDYSEKNEELSVTSYGVTLDSNKIKNEDVAVSQFKKDDLILVTGVVESGKLVVKTAKLADKVEEVKVSAYKDDDSVTAGGTKYEYNAKINYAPDGGWVTGAGNDNYNLQKTSYDLVLDNYGYVIGVEKHSDEVTLDDILFVKDADKSGFNWLAKVIFMDGSEKTVTIAGTQMAGGSSYEEVTGWQNGADCDDALTADGKISEKRFFEFNEKSNGEYELKDIANARQGKATATGDSTKKNIVGGEVKPIYDGSTPTLVNKTANNNTIFIAKDTVYTGVKNSPSVSDADVYYLLDNDSKNYILAAYTAEKGVSTVDASEYVYIFSGNGKGQDEKDNTYYTYTAIKDGEKLDNGFQAATNGKGNGLYQIETYENGYPVLKTALTTHSDDVYTYATVGEKAGITYKNGVVTAGSEGFVMADDAQVYVVDVAKKSVDVIDPSSADKDSLDDGNYAVCAVYESTSSKDVKVLWLIKGSTGRQAVYTSGTIAESSIVETPAANKITIDGVDLAVTNTTDIDALVTAINADNTLKTKWTAAKSGEDITLTAKSAGAIAEDDKPAGLIETTPGENAKTATGSVKLTQSGDTVTIDGTTVAFNSAAEVSSATSTATQGTYKYTVTGSAVDGWTVTFTAATAGDAANDTTTTCTVGGDSTVKVNITGGADAIEAVFTLEGVAAKLAEATTAGETLAVGGHTAPVSGATLSAKLDAFVTHYNANATGNSTWTASKGADNASITFTARTVGDIAGPAGTTLVTKGENAVSP